MRALARLARDDSGSMMPRYAALSGVVACFCVLGTWTLDRLTRGEAGGAALGVLAAHSSAAPDGSVLSQTTVDFTPTGSIPQNLAAPVVLDPCTGARKN